MKYRFGCNLLVSFFIVNLTSLQSPRCSQIDSEIEFLSKTLAITDKAESVAQFNSHYVRIEEKKSALLNFSEWMSKNTDFIGVHGKDMNLTYMNFFRLVEAIFPESQVCNYFYHCEKPIFSLGAMKALINYYQTDSEYSRYFSNIYALSVDEFEIELQSWKDFGLPFNGRRTYLVRSDKEHFTPLFIENLNGSLKVVISNSTGILRHFAGVLYTLFRNKLPESKLYILAPGRQKDGSSCPMMSLDDVFSHLKEDIFQFVDFTALLPWTTSNEALLTAKDSFPKDQNTLLIEQFPMTFMRVTQDRNLINDYLLKMRTDISQRLEPLSDLGLELSLIEMMAENQELPETVQNRYLRQRIHHHYHIILQIALQEGGSNFRLP